MAAKHDHRHCSEEKQVNSSFTFSYAIIICVQTKKSASSLALKNHLNIILLKQWGGEGGKGQTGRTGKQY